MRIIKVDSLNIVNKVLNKNAIELNSTTSTKILDACKKGNPRLYYRVVNNSSHDVWVKEQATNIDNDKKGILIPKKTTHTSMAGNSYIGEICAIAVTDLPSVYVSQY